MMKLIKLFSVLLINILCISTAFAAIGYTNFKVSKDKQSFSISIYGGIMGHTYYLDYYDNDNNLRQQIKLCRSSYPSPWCKATVRYDQLPKFNQGDYIVFLNFLTTNKKLGSPRYVSSKYGAGRFKLVPPKDDTTPVKKEVKCKAEAGTEDFAKVICPQINVKYLQKIENFKVTSKETIPSLIRTLNTL